MDDKIKISNQLVSCTFAKDCILCVVANVSSYLIQGRSANIKVSVYALQPTYFSLYYFCS